MKSALALRLEAFGALPETDVATLDELSRHGRRRKAGEDLIREGDKPGGVLLVTEGVACRYKQLADGKRQIVAYLLPGDFCDLHVFILEAMDHNLSALCDCVVAEIPQSRVLAMLEKPALAKALLMTTLVDEATLREWISNIGQRPARDRLAHFFCEIYTRLEMIGRVSENSVYLPINQSQLADTVGLSLVHTNKSLRALREAGAATFQSGRLDITNMVLLRKLAGFKPNYLHLKNAEEGGDADGSLENASAAAEI